MGMGGQPETSLFLSIKIARVCLKYQANKVLSYQLFVNFNVKKTYIVKSFTVVCEMNHKEVKDISQCSKQNSSLHVFLIFSIPFIFLPWRWFLRCSQKPRYQLSLDQQTGQGTHKNYAQRESQPRTGWIRPVSCFYFHLPSSQTSWVTLCSMWNKQNPSLIPK